MSSGTIEYDWTQSEEQIIVDMIRADNEDKPLTTDMVIFGVPEELQPDVTETYNVMVSVTATPVAPFRGSQNHRYHRVDVTEFVHPTLTDLEFELTPSISKSAFVAELGDRLGVRFNPDRVIFTHPDGVGPHIVSMADTSLCYFGHLEVMFTGLVEDVDLEEAIHTPELDGFDS